MTAPERPILLSVAIPTKNRQPYLINLLDDLLRSKNSDFEVVIHDNSDDNQLAAYVAGCNDLRVHYTYTDGWLSVVDNCDAAIRSCSGHYICLLGDDDGIMLTESLEVLENARADDVDAVMSDVLLYTWPDISHRSIRNLAGKLYFDPLIGGSGRRSAKRNVRRAVRRAGAMGMEGLPCVYQGFVARSVLAEVDRQTGSSFPGPSPDMANAIGIAPYVTRPRHVPRPLVIAGHSRKSAAGQGTMKEHRGAISAQPHLPADTAETWYPQIPFFWSGPTIYAQSVHRAIERTGTTSLGQPSDACLYAACLMFEWSYRGETFRAMRESREPLLLLAPQMAYYAVIIGLKRLVQFVKNQRVSYFPGKVSASANSIADAIHIIRARGL